MSKYLKFLAQVLATLLAAVGASLAGNGTIDSSEWINVLIVGLGAIAVLGAGNLPDGIWRYTKTIVSGATAGAVFLQSAITDGLSQAELVQLILAVAGAVGVFAVKGPIANALSGSSDPANDHTY